MNIPINKDFETAYKENAWKGYSRGELKYGALGLAVALISGGLLIGVLKVHYQTGIYLSVFCMAPVVAAGFWKSKNGLSLTDYYKAVKYREKTQRLVYKAREYRFVEPEEELPFPGKSKAERRKMVKDHKKYVKKLQKEQRTEQRRLQEGAKKK